ncbi:hypothetical protein RRG08_065311 [Elysia crispata]|uniref:Uncharacterized protein n=1 Tax=Elysia crispata TaxID=231223 RepID=A0AAE0ZTT2_9GAST|nr:hypothetical protein RRG08_065311 [Elysia crispata]
MISGIVEEKKESVQMGKDDIRDYGDEIRVCTNGNLQLHSSQEVQHPKRTSRISIFSSTGETAVQTCVMFNVSTRQLPRSAMSTGSRQAGEKLSRCRLTRVMRDVSGPQAVRL